MHPPPPFTHPLAGEQPLGTCEMNNCSLAPPHCTDRTVSMQCPSTGGQSGAPMFNDQYLIRSESGGLVRCAGPHQG